jgi:hypothetical protein
LLVRSTREHGASCEPPSAAAVALRPANPLSRNALYSRAEQ